MLYLSKDPRDVKRIDPRGILRDKGPNYLSDVELLAIILGSGTKSKSVMRLAADLLFHLECNNYSISLQSLLKLKGLGLAKASSIAAMLELCKRVLLPTKDKIQSPDDLLPLLQNYAYKNQEYFLSVYLNGASKVISHSIVSIGLINQTLVHPREVFADAVKLRATSIIVAHNHPSGYVDPSIEDIESTKRIKSASELLGIPLLDHIIFSEKKYYSFKEQGTL